MNVIDNKIYQTAIIIPQNVWEDVVKRIDTLENQTKLSALQSEFKTELEDTFYTTEEAALILKIHPLSLGRCVKSGHIRCVKKDGRANYYSLKEINRYKESRPRYKN